MYVVTWSGSSSSNVVSYTNNILLVKDCMRKFYLLNNNIMEEDRIKELEEENDKLRKKIKELREEIGELEDEKDELESDNDYLRDQIDDQVDPDDVLGKVVNAIDRRFRRHPNPDPITLEWVISEIKDAISSFNS